MKKPLAIDLYCGLGGWTDGLLAEGYDVIGFDIEQHEYWVPEVIDRNDGSKGTRPVAKRGWTQGCAISLGLEGPTAQPRTRLLKYPGQLVIQDVRTLHGSQFKTAALIVASPPCQAYSYRAMPWKKAKALPPPDNELFETCFRIQREASEAAGRHIPMVVENVRGAQKWVGRARWNFGSFYLWGDVPALMPPTLKAAKVPGFRFDGSGKSFQSASVEATGIKGIPHRTTGHWTNPAEHHSDDNGRKIGGDWFSDPNSTCRRHGSKSKGRKMASAMIAKIPLPLSRHVAATFKPKDAWIGQRIAEVDGLK